jgi:hypothetical protein
MRQTLVSVEMALTTALLASAALFLHSFVNVTRADRGYQVEHVLALELAPGGPRYATVRSERRAFADTMATYVEYVL